MRSIGKHSANAIILKYTVYVQKTIITAICQFPFWDCFPVVWCPIRFNEEYLPPGEYCNGSNSSRMLSTSLWRLGWKRMGLFGRMAPCLICWRTYSVGSEMIYYIICNAWGRSFNLRRVVVQLNRILVPFGTRMEDRSFHFYQLQTTFCFRTKLDSWNISWNIVSLVGLGPHSLVTSPIVFLGPRRCTGMAMTFDSSAPPFKRIHSCLYAISSCRPQQIPRILRWKTWLDHD